MKIGMLGTGTVGRTVATALVDAGHEVRIGGRQRNNPTALAWVEATGSGASQGSFEDAARHGEVVFNCTAGTASLEALTRAGAENLAAKILVDVANPLDFSRGLPPSFTVCNTDSLGEQIQRAFPAAKVVKALNTVSHRVMVNPARVPGQHHLLLCGNDASAKREVAHLLATSLGWPPGSLLDLGDITAARGSEMLVAAWVRLWGAMGTPDFNFQVVGPTEPITLVPSVPMPVANPAP